jgi:hypothetical protein
MGIQVGKQSNVYLLTKQSLQNHPQISRMDNYELCNQSNKHIFVMILHFKRWKTIKLLH